MIQEAIEDDNNDEEFGMDNKLEWTIANFWAIISNVLPMYFKESLKNQTLRLFIIWKLWIANILWFFFRNNDKILIRILRNPYSCSIYNSSKNTCPFACTIPAVKAIIKAITFESTNYFYCETWHNDELAEHKLHKSSLTINFEVTINAPFYVH